MIFFWCYNDIYVWCHWIQVNMIFIQKNIFEAINSLEKLVFCKSLKFYFLDFQKNENLKIWKYEILKIWKSENLKFWKLIYYITHAFFMCNILHYTNHAFLIQNIIYYKKHASSWKIYHLQKEKWKRKLKKKVETKFQNLKIWKSENLKIWKYENMKIGKNTDMFNSIETYQQIIMEYVLRTKSKNTHNKCTIQKNIAWVGHNCL